MTNTGNIQEIKIPTAGEFYVTTSDKYVDGGEPTYIVVAVAETNQIVAIVGAENDEALASEHIANAALFAVSKHLLDLVIDVQIGINSPEGLDRDEINEAIQIILAKLANEAGEEL